MASMATTQNLFDDLLKIRIEVKTIKNQFSNDKKNYDTAQNKYNNVTKINTDIGNSGSDWNKLRKKCESKKDLVNPTTDNVTIAIKAYDDAQTKYTTACGKTKTARTGWFYTTSTTGTLYLGALETLEEKYTDYDTSNNSLYPQLDYLKMYVLILSTLHGGVITGDTDWLNLVLGTTLAPSPLPTFLSVPMTITDTVDGFIKKIQAAITTSTTTTVSTAIAAITIASSVAILQINKTIATLKSNTDYIAAYALYKGQELLLDAEYNKLILTVYELEFIANEKVREPKSLDDAFKTFLKWLQAQPTNDTMDPAHLKYQVTDKLISIENNLGKTLVKDYTRDDFLSETRVCGINATGKECLHILHQCLSGKTSDDCLKRWNTMNFSGGVNFLEGDKAVAMKLGKKLGLDLNSVKKVCDDFATSTGKPLNQNVQTILHSIKAVYTNKPSIPAVIPVWTFVPPLIGGKMINGKMVGGGTNVSYADFIRGFDSLKNNIHISGGALGPNTAVAFRNNYQQLKSILTSNGKTLDAIDDTRMDEYINSIERSEKRLDKLKNLIQILKKLYSDPVGKQLLDKDIGVKNVTLELLSELTEQHKNSTGALTGKISNYFTSYGSLVNSREIQDMLKKHLEDVKDAIKAKSP